MPQISGARGALAPALLALAPLTLMSCSHPVAEPRDLDYHRGRNALSMARSDWARIHFAADLEKNPGRPESLYGLGQSSASGQEGSLSRAVEAFESYLEIADDPAARLQLARAYFRLGRSSEALTALDRAPATFEADVLKARVLLDADPKAADTHLALALEKAPNAFAPHLVAARAAARLGDDERAAAHAARAAEIDPLEPDAFYVLASSLKRLGRARDADAALREYELARRLRTLDPREELELLLARHPEPEALPVKVRLARLFLTTGRFDEGSRASREVAADPRCGPGTLFELAQAAHARRRVALARELYARALDKNPEHLGALAQQAHLAYESNRLEEARRLVDAGLEADLHYAPFHFTRGLIALTERREDEASEALATAVALAPWLTRYRTTLADLYLARGDRRAFARLLAEAPADPALEVYKKKHSV